MDRTIPPENPGGEDAGVVVGAVGRDSMGHSSTTGSSRGKVGSKPTADTKAKAAPVGSRIDAMGDRAGVPVAQAGKSSAARGQ